MACEYKAKNLNLAKFMAKLLTKTKPKAKGEFEPKSKALREDV